MVRRKSMLGKRNRLYPPIDPIATSAVRPLGPEPWSAEGWQDSMAQLRGRPPNFTEMWSSARKKSQLQFCGPQHVTSHNPRAQRTLFPKNKENVGPKYHSSPVQNAGLNLRSSAQKTPRSYASTIPDSPNLIQSGSSKRYAHFSPLIKTSGIKKFNDGTMLNAVFSKTPTKVTTPSNAFISPESPMLLRSASSKRFSCITGQRAQVVTENQDIASVIIARTLLKSNSNSSSSSISKNSNVASLPSVSSNKYSDQHISNIEKVPEETHNSYLSENLPAPRENVHKYADCKNIRLSTISERTESPLENDYEIAKPQVDVPALKSETCNTNSNRRTSTSLVRSVSKLPVYVKGERNLEEKSKSCSLEKNKSEIKTSTKNSLPKIKHDINKVCNDDLVHAHSESKIMTRSKRKSLELNIEIPDKKFCSVNSGIYVAEKSENSNSLQMTTEYASKTFYSSDRVQSTVNKSYNSTDVHPVTLCEDARDTDFLYTEILKKPSKNMSVCMKATQTDSKQSSPFGTLTVGKASLSASTQTDGAILDTISQNDDYIYINKKVLFDIMTQAINKTLSDLLGGTADVQIADLSNEKNIYSTQHALASTPKRRSQRIAARMSTGNSCAALDSPEASDIGEYKNIKSCPSTSELNKSLKMYKDLRSDFSFLKTPKSTNRTSIQSPDRYLGNKVHNQLKLLFD